MTIAAREPRERGQVLVLFAFVLVALLLVSALAVDYGGWLLARRSYQNIADEAAIAGSYQLSNPSSADCDQGVGISKQACAREAAWQTIEDHVGNLPTGETKYTLGATSSASVGPGGNGVSWNGWTVWVASPPSDAGSYYTGFASSTKTVFVRVQRQLDPGLSRIIQSTTTIGAWATAGRIPENFAILTLCQTGCLAGGADLQVAGNGSNLILESGDLGSNSYGKTSGNNASIALCDGTTGTLSQCSAYMHTPSQCTATSVSCQIDRWNGTTVDTSTRYSAIALPQVVDPQYRTPTLSDTTDRSSGVVGGTTPMQCYSIIDSTAPAVSMAQPANQYAVNDPFGLVAAQLPPTPAPVTLGAVTLSGTVTAFSGGAAIANATVKFTPSSGPAKSGTTNASGAYSISGVGAGTYSITVTDPTGTYQTYTESGYSVGSSNQTKNFTMHKNPSFTGTVYDSLTLTPLSGATVTVTGSGGPFTATTNASGVYTVYVTGTTASYSLTASMANYASSSTTLTSGALDSPSQTASFGLNPNNGTIQGTVTSGGVGVVGATVTAGTYTTTTGAGGAYSIGVTPGTYSMTATATGYSTATATVTVGAGGTVTQNFTIVGNNATVTGHVYDQTTGLALAGVTVTAANGVTSGSATTNSAGLYSITNLSPSNPKYTVTASITGWNTQTLNNKTVSAPSTTIDFAATAGNGLWPANCGSTGANKGRWDCGNGSGCTGVVNPTGIDVGCSSYNDTNRIRPGTYKSITIGNAECAWIDPVGGVPGLTSGQSGGIVYVTDYINIGSDAFLLGDGVTIVVASGAYVDVGNQGGFAINYGGANCDPVPGTPTSCAWRTAAYIGNNTGTATNWACTTDVGSFADLRRGGFTTGGAAQVARLTWTSATNTSGSTPCYQDGSSGSYLTTNKGEIGMAWYLRGADTSPGSHRFAFSSTMGFLFDGVLYGPRDDIDLGGQGAQAAAGQIVAWTLKYHGDTDIHQRYSGIEIDGPPYLIEPYIGE